VATTPTDTVCRQLALSWGVRPRRAEYGAGVEAVIDATVGAALDAGVAQSGDTLVVLSGMMTDMEGANTTNTLKVHVAAEAVATGRTIVDGRVAGPVARTVDGDLSGVPAGAVLVLPAEFDGEFTGEMDRVAAIVDARPGMTGYPALVARELDVPMVSGAPLPDRVAAGDLVTLHAGRGVVYEGDVIRDDSR
jgi:pyruvate kinase